MNDPYILERCCMCPNSNDPMNMICPGIPKSLHPDPSPCRLISEENELQRKRSLEAERHQNDMAVIDRAAKIEAEWDDFKNWYTQNSKKPWLGATVLEFFRCHPNYRNNLRNSQ